MVVRAGVLMEHAVSRMVTSHVADRTGTAALIVAGTSIFLEPNVN
jgi:hypothetical protein